MKPLAIAKDDEVLAGIESEMNAVSVDINKIILAAKKEAKEKVESLTLRLEDRLKEKKLLITNFKSSNSQFVAIEHGVVFHFKAEDVKK